MYNTYKIR